jgi:hypothetical protein
MVSLLASCATTPYLPVPAGSRVIVRYVDDSTGIELALANESYPELADVYSRPRDNANLKLAEDRLMGELLASLENAGMPEFGRADRPGDGPQGTYIFVDQDGKQRLFRKPGSRAPESARVAFVKMTLIMSEYYQHVGGSQYVDNPDGHRFFGGQR